MIACKLLNKDCPQDRIDLKDILNVYAKGELLKVNPVYVASNLVRFASWIYDRFVNCDHDDFAVAAMYEYNQLVHIMVGYKFDIGFGFDSVINTEPYWYVGLAFFRDQKWRNPGEHVIRLGFMLRDVFERQGFYKFYTVKKCSPKLMSDSEKMKDYVKSPSFKETFRVERYSPKIEKIFRTTADLERFSFINWQKLLPRSISKPIMLIEYTLDPLIDINKIIDDHKNKLSTTDKKISGTQEDLDKWM